MLGKPCTAGFNKSIPGLAAGVKLFFIRTKKVGLVAPPFLLFAAKTNFQAD